MRWVCVFLSYTFPGESLGKRKKRAKKGKRRRGEGEKGGQDNW